MHYRLDKSAWLHRESLVENDDELSALVYAREVHTFRHFYRYWLTPHEANLVFDELCETFNVPRIALGFKWGRVLRGRFFGLGSNFDTYKIELQGREGSRWHRWNFEGRDTKCKQFSVNVLLPAGHVCAHTLLHEAAHFLCVVWWNHYFHDGLFTSVEEMLHDWYRARKGRKYARGKDIHYVSS